MIVLLCLFSFVLILLCSWLFLLYVILLFRSCLSDLCYNVSRYEIIWRQNKSIWRKETEMSVPATISLRTTSDSSHLSLLLYWKRLLEIASVLSIFVSCICVLHLRKINQSANQHTFTCYHYEPGIGQMLTISENKLIWICNYFLLHSLSLSRLFSFVCTLRSLLSFSISLFLFNFLFLHSFSLLFYLFFFISS